jgi:predicted unusual protein kinase regulating ubiquinone biosynthesis (AarF/ABC1/UbiB family)
MQVKPLKISSFSDFSQRYDLMESVETDAKEISTEIDFEEMEDVDPDKIAATLSKLIDAGGDIDKIDIDQIAENFQQIMEEENVSEDENLNESATGMVYVLEVVGTILGNADLLHFIGDVLSKKLGRKVDVSNVAQKLKVMVDALKKATGYPAKIIKKFFEWIGKLFGMDKASVKIMGLVGLGLATVVMLVIGVIYFPAAAALTGTSGILTVILSIGALIGKAAEITVVIKEVVEVMKAQVEKAAGGDSSELTAQEIEKALGNLTLEI